MSNAVSFSRAMLYKKCPASYEWQYVLGNKPEFNPTGAAARGLRVHDSIEQAFLQEDVTLLDGEIPDKVLPHILEHHGRPDCEARPEMPWALTKEWEPTEFEAEDAYLRGLMDNVFIYSNKVIIHEYKTGQEYDEHADQKQLYALVALVLWPEIEEVEVVGIYIDKKKVVPTKYSRGHLMTMKYTWKRLVDKMNIPIYPARPGMHCRWCPKSSKHGGGSCPVG